jgi:radical SAM superfamily enzyme YgiQ (UPF0313 family)
MRAVLVQPPFTQLNAPYPAIHYLESYLRNRGFDAQSFDHSIGLYRRIFSRPGLEKVFYDARRSLDSRNPGDSRDHRATTEIRRQIDRYLSYEPHYLEWIEPLVNFLSGSDPGMAHRLAAAAELPRGARTQAFLESLDGRIAPDDALALATRILEDLGDFITFTLDPDFGTVRYAERLASSRADFAEVIATLDNSWLINEFYKPYLDEFWSKFPPCGTPHMLPDLVLISIPFPGCLLGALACARAFRTRSNHWGQTPTNKWGQTPANRPRIAFGGSYVSTELRGLRDSAIFDYCDYLCFDAGFGALSTLPALSASGNPDNPAGSAIPIDPATLYRTMIRRKDDGAILVCGFPENDTALADTLPARTDTKKNASTSCPAAAPAGVTQITSAAHPATTQASAAAPAPAPRIAIPNADYQSIRRHELDAIASTFPDYRSANYAEYLRIVDSDNPMHRLWSDTPWLKFNLAHGCYWRRCSFCDTELEYVADFVRARTGELLAAAQKASNRTGLRGIHFVDEAMPMASLLEFARALRRREGGPFTFWGNVRFDASWTESRCEFLAASGLVAVSGGIEIATERGLAMTDKGFDLAGLVRTLVAMRRAGLLVHAYLIYGFPGQPDVDIVDSAECCRQLFASGLIDSAFWHRFVLTRHSRMYREWRDDTRPDLRPIDRPWSFAHNDLSFEGSSAFDRFDAPLDAALAAWMAGDQLDRPVATWFGRGFPRATLAPDHIERLIAAAETALDLQKRHPSDRATAFWLAGRPLLSSLPPRTENRSRLTWAYRGDLHTLDLPRSQATALAELLESPTLTTEGLSIADISSRFPEKTLEPLFSAGLVYINGV